MTDSMVERVARAIAEEQHKSWLYDERTCAMCDPARLEGIREALKKAARAAIAAMREPTEAMVGAGDALDDPGCANDGDYGYTAKAPEHYQAMIDEALK